MKSPLKSLRNLRKRTKKQVTASADLTDVSTQDGILELEERVETPTLTPTPDGTRSGSTPFSRVLDNVTTPLKAAVDASPLPMSFAQKKTVGDDGRVNGEISDSVEDANNEQETKETVTIADKEEIRDESKIQKVEPKQQQEASLQQAENADVGKEVKKEEVKSDVKNEQKDPVYEVQANTILMALFGICAMFWMLVSWIFGYRTMELIYYAVLSMAGTVAYVYLYTSNQRKKQNYIDILNVTPGTRGLSKLLKDSPTWLSYTKKEKVEWFNKLLSQAWPYYDRAVCEAIKESVEPIMQSVKPPVFKDIRFSSLRFGEVPFRVEGLELETTDNEIILDLDIRWCGDASVSLAIEPNLPSMTEATTMCPKVKDLSCFGTLRLTFKPLVSEMPGFGAVTTSFLKTPSIRFSCDFGRALGGNVSGNLVRNALDPFIKDTLASMLCWPQRLVTPIIYNEEVTGPLEDLELRHVGLLTVKVEEATRLPAADMNNSSDPTIELWTRPEKKFNTAVVKRTINPVWENEIHHLLIQEPRSQNLHVTAYDVDFINMSEVFKSVNILKNLRESVYAKEFLGRCEIPLKSITLLPMKETVEWYELGKGEFADVSGPGTGCGSVRLKMIYTPFSMLKVQKSLVGVVLVDVIRCRDLVAMDRGGTSDPYVKVKVGDVLMKSHVIAACCDPEFRVKFEFFDVEVSATIHLSVHDKDFMSRDDPLGHLNIPVKDLAASKSGELPGHMRQWFELEDVSHGEVFLKLQYIPMDTVGKFLC